MDMTPNKPYIIRAFYDWIVDNQLTPYVLVDASIPGTQVPEEHIRNGLIVLNISPSATRGLLLENDKIVFSARFSGEVQQVCVSPKAVIEIYAKENGRGITFGVDEDEGGEPPESFTPGTQVKSKNKPGLKLVK